MKIKTLTIVGFFVSFLSIYAITGITLPFSECITPTDNLVINSDTILCSGEYYLTDPDWDGVIKMSTSNVILNCDGATLNGNNSEGYGIYAEDVHNITIRNCNIEGYTWGGIQMENVNSSKIDKNNISSSGQVGHGAIFMAYSSNNNITNNRLTSNNNSGIVIGMWYPPSCNNNRIIGNTITNNAAGGIRIYNPSTNTWIENNYVCGNSIYDIYSADPTIASGVENTCDDNGSYWNDTGVIGCTYSCSATTTTTTTSTTLITTTTTLPGGTGDINSDGQVNLIDLALMGQSWGSSEGEANYNENADLNSDGIINLIDLALLGQNWG